MPNSPFDRLPPSNPEKLRAAIKQSINVALCSFREFIESVPKSVLPDLPSPAILQMFMAQLRAFRPISNRKDTATPIQLIRDIDQRWRMNIFRTLSECVDSLEKYLGSDQLHDTNAGVIFARPKERPNAEVIPLLMGERVATAHDLPLLRPFVRDEFARVIDLANKARPARGCRQDIGNRFRDSVAVIAQEHLLSKHQHFMIKAAAAKSLRQFLFNLKHPPFQKRLFGLSDDGIDKWKSAQPRELTRRRKRRSDERKREKRRYSFVRRKRC